MFYEDFNIENDIMYNQVDSMLENSKKLDKGYNVIYRKVQQKNGK